MSDLSEDEELLRRRRKLETDRIALEEEELQVKRLRLQREIESLQPPPSILRLNVGGQGFDTTRETLLGAKSTFFARLLGMEGGTLQGALRDADGCYFINRSPEGLRLVLEWLRGNTEVDSPGRVNRDTLVRKRFTTTCLCWYASSTAAMTLRCQPRTMRSAPRQWPFAQRLARGVLGPRSRPMQL